MLSAAMQLSRRHKRWSCVMINRVPPRAPGSAASLFEVWLQTDLQRLYDRALREPLPDDLLRLLPLHQESDLQQT